MPRLARPAAIAALAARHRLSDPRRADLAAALRPPRPLAGRLRLRPDRPRAARTRSRPTSSSASARCRPASRCASGSPTLDEVAAARRRSRLTAGTSRPGSPARSSAPTRRPLARGARRDARASRRRPSVGAGVARRRRGARAEAIAAELERVDEPTEPGLHARSAALYADGDLVYTASSMPIRDQEAFLRRRRRRRRSSSPTAAPTGSTG